MDPAPSTSVRLWALGAVALLAAGCPDAPAGSLPDAGADGGPDATCAATLKAYGPACLPVLDDCKGSTVPMPGGGCKAVGVETCTGGLRLPSSTCTQVGRPAACPAGWARTSGGWCEPTLPASTCSAGTTEVIGKTSCQPLGSCGSGTFGSIKTTSSTIFVDGSYSDGSSDGSESKPYTSIGEALGAAPEGGQVAIAAGTYDEDLTISKKVTLQGRCAELVTIAGQKSTTTSAALTVQADGVEISDVTVTGAGGGIRSSGADATLRRVAVLDCEQKGVAVTGGSSLTLVDSLVSGNRSEGLYVDESEATVDRTVVRETRADSSGQTSYGIQVGGSSTTSASLVLRDSVVEDNRSAGIILFGAQATLVRSLVRRSLPDQASKKGGAGIVAQVDGAASKVSLEDVVVANNAKMGVLIIGSTATLVRAVVRDTQPSSDTASNGFGLVAEADGGTMSNVSMTDSVVTDNRAIGVSIDSSKVKLERTLVQRTLSRASDGLFGAGIQASSDSARSTLDLSDCIVTQNQFAGLYLFDSQVSLSRTIVSSNKAEEKTSRYGSGIYAHGQTKSSSSVSLKDCLLDQNQTSGASVEFTALALERTVVRATQPTPQDSTMGRGVEVYSDVGPSSLTLEESLVASNREVGILLSAVKSSLDRSEVRDTLPMLADLRLGVGIKANQGTLTLKDSLVSRSRFIGVAIMGASATLERSAIRDTREEQSTKEYGVGLSAEVDGTASVTLTDCAITKATAAGATLWGARGTFVRSLVQDTRSQVSDGTAGVGISAATLKGTGSALTLTSCVVERSRAAGISLEGSGTITSTIVREVSEDANGFGDGLEIWSATGGKRASASLGDVLVEDAVRAGLVYHNAGGSVEKSTFRRGVFAIDLEGGADPELADDNVFEDNQENRVTYGEGLSISMGPSIPDL
jgi:hypothetical protein